MSRRWILTGQEGFETSLEYQRDVKVPSASELGPKDVLVELHAASLNYRELVIAGPAVSRRRVLRILMVYIC
jgi:NADPH:quinone reductase-like Zn-dependent oxidoreductase